MIKNWIVVSLFGLSLAFLSVAFIVVSVGFYEVEGPFIIHFNDLGKVDFIGEAGNVFNIVIIGTVIVAINFVLAYRLYGKEIILSYIFSGVSFVLATLVLVASYLISSLN